MARGSMRLAVGLALTGLASAAGAVPQPVAPAAATRTVGAFTMTALRDELNVVPNDGSVFGKDVGSAPVATVLRKADAAADRVTLAVDALLVQGGGRTMLFDTGLGPKVGGVLMASLQAAGVSPDAVTDVFITHAHPDHVGGLRTADGTLAFPNAAIRMSAAEWTWMQAKGDPALVALITPRVRTFAAGATVLPGVRSESLPGHTPGHVGYHIGSGAGQLFDIGDSAHSSIVSLADPGWVIGYDGDPAEGKASRERALREAAAGHMLVWAPHFPYPGFGHIVRAGSGYRWVPQPA